MIPMIFPLFYGGFIAAFIATIITVYIKLRHHGKIKAMGASLLMGALLFLFLPIPIHGGFTFLFEVAFEELQDRMQERNEIQKEEKASAFRIGLQSRFSGVLPFQVVTKESHRWYEVKTAEGTRGWHDSTNGLVWSEAFAGVGSGNRPSLEEAASFCRHLPPAGFWAIPTEAERYHFWKSGGQELFDDQGYGSISGLVDTDLQMVLPVIDLGGGAGLAVRCIARGPGAPARGYIQSDIPLEEWNRFQMVKLSPPTNKTNRAVDRPWHGDANRRQ